MTAMTSLDETIPAALRVLKPAEQAILGEIQRQPNQSRAQIAKKLALSPALLSKTIGTFLTENWITEERVAQPTGRGQPALKLRVRPRAMAGVGLSLTTNGVVAATVGADGETLRLRRDATPATHRSGVARTVELVRDMMASAERYCGVTIKVPGVIAADGTITEVTPTQSAIDFEYVRDRLQDALALPVWFESRVAAIDEAMRTRLNDAVIFVLVLDYGVGGSLISGRRLFRGASGQAGNIGALVPDSGPRPALPDLAGHLGLDLAQLDPEALDATEPRIGDWMATRGRGLSDALSAVVQLLNPTDIVIGGMFPRPIIEGLIRHVDLQRFDHPGRSPVVKPRLRAARTVGSSADAVAAAMTALHWSLTQPA